MRLTVDVASGGLLRLPGAGRDLAIAADQALALTIRELRDRGRETLASRIDRPRPFTLNALQLVAPPGAGVAELRFREIAGRTRHYLDVLDRGDRRGVTGVESLLRRAGRLLPGEFLVPGSDAFLDGNGNVPRRVIARMLSDLRATVDPTAFSTRRTRRRRRASDNGAGFFRGRNVFFFGGRDFPGSPAWLPLGIYEKQARGGGLPLMWYRVVRGAPDYDGDLNLRATLRGAAPTVYRRAFAEAVARRLARRAP